VPDWNQPYFYAPGPNGGPGPDPDAGGPNTVDQWNAWCAPTSASNLVGHYDDHHGISTVADGVAYAGSAVNWGAGASYQDYLADSARPAPRAAGLGGPPYVQTDIGWFMDTNRGIAYDAPAVGTMGGDDLGANPNHVGTYVKDIDIGLSNYLTLMDPTAGWTTGTRGISHASGLCPDQVTPATTHNSAASAFGELMGEISLSHTMILSYSHWVINNTGLNLAPSGPSSDESSIGGTYFTWGTYTGGPSAEGDEEWNGQDGATSLGHAVTAVGFIPAGDPDDQWAAAGLGGPTDWVIVHDNWSGTPRNVIVPFNYGATWVANTNAVPEPGALLLILSGAGLLLFRRWQR
jgi:hypothetical protein